MFLALAAAAVAVVAAVDPGRELPFDMVGWELSGPGAKVEELDGRKALRISSGRATRRDVELRDGTIEFDMRPSGDRSFAYIQFRMESDSEYEEVYFRPHKSRLPDAVQYNPVFQGLGNWQLYHGPDGTAAANLAAGVWTHVRVVLSGEKAALFVGDGPEPRLVVPKLARAPRGGFIALRGFLPRDQPASEPPVSFANVVVRPGVVGFDFSKVAASGASPRGVVSHWALSPAFVPPDGPLREAPARPGGEGWKTVAAEASGLLVLGRHVSVPEKARRYSTVAQVSVRASEAGARRFRFGYSDEVSVLLNGELLFSGDASYSFNFPRQEGLIHLDQGSLYLPLRKGDNLLRLIVSETFGGWGVMGQFEAPEGLEVSPAPGR